MLSISIQAPTADAQIGLFEDHRDLGTILRPGNDHGLSPDRSPVAVSDQTLDEKLQVQVLPSSGGTPPHITPDGPSYWHGRLPDGKTQDHEIKTLAKLFGGEGTISIPFVVSGHHPRRLPKLCWNASLA